MKAIKLIKAITDGWLNTDYGCGTLSLADGVSHVDYFGTDEKWKGYLVQGADYFYLYIEKGEEEQAYRAIGELPNAYYERIEEGDVIALWRVE